MENEQLFYMSIAQRVSTASRCERNKIGALLEKDGNIIAFGYNGTPIGFPNKCEENASPTHGLTTKPEVLHAESNALMKCARSTHSSEGANLYITVAPCFDCAKLIIQGLIKRVYYVEEYRDPAGLELLERAGIITFKIHI